MPGLDPLSPTATPPLKIDTNGDGHISGIDLILVVEGVNTSQQFASEFSETDSLVAAEEDFWLLPENESFEFVSSDDAIASIIAVRRAPLEPPAIQRPMTALPTRAFELRTLRDVEGSATNGRRVGRLARGMGNGVVIAATGDQLRRLPYSITPLLHSPTPRVAALLHRFLWSLQPRHAPGLRELGAEVDEDGSFVLGQVVDAGVEHRVAVDAHGPRDSLRVQSDRALHG